MMQIDTLRSTFRTGFGRAHRPTGRHTSEKTDVIRRSYFSADVTDSCLQGFSLGEQERFLGEPRSEGQPGDEVPAVRALSLPDEQHSAGEPQAEVQCGDEEPAAHALPSPDVGWAAQLSA
jgi:hypothetical protein